MSIPTPMKMAAFIPLFSASLLWGEIPYTKQDDGVLFTMPDNRAMKVQVCSESIIRVVYSATMAIPAPASYIVVKSAWAPVTWDTAKASGALSIKTSKVKVDVSLTDGKISYFDASGGALLNDLAPLQLVKNTTQNCYEGTIQFNSTADEGIYGFGQFQNGIFNQRGLKLNLAQKNQTDCSPVFLSTRGFGVLWNNYSSMTVDAPLKLWSSWATNDAIDYYFMYGPEFDQIIASYRTITGPATLWPKWAYGFWQCKNYYSAQYDIITAVKTFRSKGYPIDNIVQDWQYYPQGQAGSNSFDANRYPDPAGMIKTLRDSLNCHFTISVWPSFASNNENKNWKFMNSKGYLLPSNDYLGQTYDPFNDSAAYYYWKFIDDSLVSKGVDGFWPDATEPESYNWASSVTAAGPSLKVFNVFPLLHSRNLYEGFRKSLGGKKRVCNLTRSYYAGSQRLGAAYWTGDIACEATTYAIQIPAGLNVCATGLPYFCTDIGGFLGNVDPNLLARWFEWGAFNPVFRIHGTRNTEFWLDPQKNVESILVKYSKLRYRLFPYVYSLAWKVTNEGYTIMRGLPFDYRADLQVRDRTDEFMFGPAFLVCPVTNILATSRAVYLPDGKWYDFWTGALLDGGKTITVQTPLETMPLFIKAGSIIPMAPEIHYAAQLQDPIELRVYTGADGAFTLYDDEGDNYNYEQGVYATIPIRWNEANGILTIGPTSGQYPGMPAGRKFHVVWVGQGHGIGGEVTATFDKEIPYTGSTLSLNKKTGEIGIKDVAGNSGNIGFTTRLHSYRFTVSVKGGESWRLRLYDLTGRTVTEKTVRGTAVVTLADRLASGIYLLSATYGNTITWKKSIIIP